MKIFERQAQSRRKHGPLPVSSASKAPPPLSRHRPEWSGPGYVKKVPGRPRPVPTPQGPAQTIQAQPLPVERQQLILDIFRDTFTASQDFEAMKPLLQEINELLLKKDVTSAFQREEYLEGYAIRWSPSRALALANLLSWICEQWKDEEWVQLLTAQEREDPAKVLCFGGGATDIMAFAGLLRQVRTSAAGRPNVVSVDTSNDLSESFDALSVNPLPNTPFNLHLLDVVDWSVIITKLYDGLTTAPTLSKYTSTTARALNASFLSPQALELKFDQVEILGLTSEDIRSMIGPVARLLTLFFVLNDLYNTSVRRTTAFLRKLSMEAPKRCLLLVVDSHAATTTAGVAKDRADEKEYPISWLLRKTLLPTKEKQDDGGEEKPSPLWEELLDDENRLYKIHDKGLRYPASLENLKLQVHLFKRL
jgi:25S rRNA (uracil2843-N3)-methyltransferase